MDLRKVSYEITSDGIDVEVRHQKLVRLEELMGVSLFGTRHSIIKKLVFSEFLDTKELYVMVPVILNHEQQVFVEKELVKFIIELITLIGPAVEIEFEEEEILIASFIYSTASDDLSGEFDYEEINKIAMAVVVKKLTMFESVQEKTEGKRAVKEEEPETLEKRVSDLEEIVEHMVKMMPEITKEIKDGVDRDKMCLESISELTDRFKLLCDGLAQR